MRPRQQMQPPAALTRGRLSCPVLDDCGGTLSLRIDEPNNHRVTGFSVLSAGLARDTGKPALICAAERAPGPS